MACVAIVQRMLRRPDQYAPRAGEEYLKHLKQLFLPYERLLAESLRTRESQNSSKRIDGA
jgi:hypothetical protein